jgi:aldose sugar dehydrogenase
MLWQNCLALCLSALLLAGCLRPPPSPTRGSAPSGTAVLPAEPTTVAPPSATVVPPSPTLTTPPQQPSPAALPAPPASPTTAATLPPAPTATATVARFPSPQVEVVASGLRVPWALAFAPDGRLFFTERPGRIRVIEKGQLRPDPVATLPVVSSGEGGLLGLALDPGFARNGALYVMYTHGSGSSARNRISRLTLRDTQAVEEVVLLEGILGAGVHDGGRLKVGPDGKLYATTGDASQRDLAQAKETLNGKILRLNLDGSIPADNPFPGSPVYSYGHRNPEGLAWQPGTGRLYETEHGPTGEMGLCCLDEVNLIAPGANYGWPVVTGSPHDARFVDPVLDSGSDTWAPSGAAFYEGDLFPAWRGDLFFGALRGQHLHRLRLGADGRTVLQEERLFEGRFGRLRDVVLGPEGALYLTTSNQDGRGQPAADDDRILRVVP